MDDRLTQKELDDIRDVWGAVMARQLDDGSVAAVVRLMTTHAIILGCTALGWERRFCFADPDRCYAEFAALRSEDDQPTGWIARRPEQPCDRAAKGSPDYLGGDPALPSSWRTQ